MLDKIILQVRKPTGFLGRLMAKGMNINHRKLTDWGFEFINKMDFNKILDIGCGGGRAINKLANLTLSQNKRNSHFISIKINEGVDEI